MHAHGASEQPLDEQRAYGDVTASHVRVSELEDNVLEAPITTLLGQRCASYAFIGWLLQSQGM